MDFWGCRTRKRSLIETRPPKGAILVDQTASVEPLCVQTGPGVWSVG